MLLIYIVTLTISYNGATRDVVIVSYNIVSQYNYMTVR